MLKIPTVSRSYGTSLKIRATIISSEHLGFFHLGSSKFEGLVSGKLLNNEMNTFIDALYLKYCYEDSDELSDEIELPQSDGHRRVCEFIGFDKIKEELRNVKDLQFIDLSDYSIYAASNQSNQSDELKLKRLRHLNISRNKIKSWTVLACIIDLAPNIEEIILTGNPLPSTISDEEFGRISEKFKRLTTVVIGNVGFTWSCFYNGCLRLWPNIEILNLFKNNISDIKIDESFLSLHNLTFLNLANNPISDWKEIYKLGRLKKLRSLELANCFLRNIRFDDEDIKKNLFHRLEHLDLSHNLIDDWRSVAELNKLNRLNTLLLRHNPIYYENKQPYYHNFNFIVGRIKNLDKLEREKLTKEVRNECEKYYVSKIFLEYMDIKHTKNQKRMKEFFLENPCLMDLLNLYGAPVVAPKLSKEELMQKNYKILTIIDENNSDQSKRKIQKQFPGIISIEHRSIN